MKVILKKAVVVVTIGMMAMLQSCSSNDDLDGYTPTNFNVGGKVEKGPFVRGTAIQMQPLDADLDETGESFTSTITDNEGTFTFGSKLLKSPYVKLSASGYYFNEVTGELSKGTLALNAVANLQNAADVNLNILSHLKYQRVMDLVAKDGKSFKEANNQAQEEVLKTFGLEKYAKTDVNHFSITSGTDEAAALIAVSSLILYNRSEAQITEYLSQLSEEFAEDGNFSETTKLQIRKDMFSLESKLPQIAENIKKRYQEMGKEVAVKNLIYYFDWDGDGTAGNEIAPENHPVSLETNNINVPMEGGSYEVKVNTTVPVYLERPSIPGDDIYDNSTSVLGMKIYETGSGSEPCINYSKELNNNILKVVVKAASFRKEQAVSIPLYDGMGNVVARLNLTQQANPNAEIIVPRLGSDGISLVSDFMRSLSETVTLEAGINYCYTKIINNPRLVAPISSFNENLINYWSNEYSSLNLIAYLYRADSMYRAVYSPYLNVYRDMCYYQMLIWWGGVVVVPNAGFESYADPSRTSESSILQMLEEELVEAIRNLDEKKCVAFATNANDALFVSKDVARILLAKVYMYQQKWAAASNLLQKVVDKSIYPIEKVPTKYTSENKDLILALMVGNESRASRVYVDGSPEDVVPIMTTTDVKLLYAECEIHLGNNAKASKYISEVDNVNGISGTSVSVEGINQLRKSLKLQDYFAFLKRNGLAIKELGLEKYQLLLPIPQNEINMNPNMTQNPGY
ncbi:RagB/SusD family nutrient uptake outer membrane protein [Segatella copri]|uniref:RagB/SusD family nutrient uptake outer membrane protein n=1 Tax=Segatella copri TaxID=165179 RepID=A0AA92T3S3_9BACT|nr:RagB/SusD family nutrient uptake outer membrane protein [Segatella copri]RGN09999.1 RagB/SusD family nutrient uptake outer membrane protein [Segatella copri]RGQ10259.1 RagB/SusD family nutrient uptake outer membrane protein [Segatella copri]